MAPVLAIIERFNVKNFRYTEEEAEPGRLSTDALTVMDVSSYLNRINYRGPREVSAETLRELHKAHLLAVPFENLDNHIGRQIVLDEEKVIRKIVDQRRGGICYELNGAFCVLL